MYHRLFHLFSLLLFSGMLTGQSGNYKTIPPEFELERIKAVNPGNGIFTGIREDRQGYLWLTGTAGIHVFDGQYQLSYQTGNKAFPIQGGSGDNIFGDITTDPQGRFWLMNGKTILLFDPIKRSLADSFVTGDRLPVFFRFGHQSGKSLFYVQSTLNENQATLFRKEKNVKPVAIFQTPFNREKIFFYDNSNLHHWMLRGDEILRLSLDGKSIKRFASPVPTLLNMFTNKETVFFVGSRQNAIYWWNPVSDQIELYSTIPAFATGKIQSFYVENDLIYIASNMYLFILDKKNGTVQDLSPQFTKLVQVEAPGHLSETMLKIYQQRGQGLLLQTVANLYRLKKKMPGIDFFRHPVFTNLPEQQTKPISYRAITESADHHIYASYYTGISVRKPGEAAFAPLPTERYRKGDMVSTYSLQYWNQHLLWNNVLINITTGQSRYMFDTLFSGHCTQYLRGDSCWLYKWSSQSLHCYDLRNNRLRTYPLQIPMDENKQEGRNGDMNDMEDDANENQLWVSSHDFGLALITKQGKLLKRFLYTELGTSDSYITDLERVGDQLWFGCTDGLGRLDIPTGRSIIFRNPGIQNNIMQNRAVFSIVPDEKGNFYLGSSSGLLYFNTSTLSFFNLMEGHPLSRIEFNRASSLKTSDGRYYMGSTNGLYSFQPGDLQFISASEPVKLVKLVGIAAYNNRQNEYNYQSIGLDSLQSLQLSPFERNLQFSFSVPEYNHAVYYSYRVKGFNDNWSEYKPENSISLSGLVPGNYLLEVKVSTALNDTNAFLYSLPIHMRQSWFKKPWVIALIVLGILGLIIWFIRNQFNQRLQRQKELAQLRTKISSDLHDDVGTILSGLAMQSQMLAYSASGEQKQSLNEISEMSREAMEHMRDTVWAMDSRKDKYENLIDRMRAFAERNLALKNFTHEFIVTEVDTKKFIDPEKRQAIYLIFKEAITNIVKHSKGNHVLIGLYMDKAGLHLTVKDNGDAHAQINSDGLGISNMTMRAEKIGGKLYIRREEGYEVQLDIPA